ncbi:MAG: hypothetical protein IKU19_04475 [Clostridia bacterium]|nr:hypothetical protein [Clostridia bacterium]
MNRILAIILCLILCLGIFAGCKDKTGDPVDTSEDTSDVTVEDTSEPVGKDTQEITESDLAEDPSVSLDSFRQSMTGTTELFAAAYIGLTDTIDDVDPIPWMKEKAPVLCSNLPFMTAIAEENIVGGHFGELYCIVPASSEINLTVSTIEFGYNDSKAEVLYEGTKGEPILLFCNQDGFSPDVEVTVTTADGNSVLWYPQLDDNLYLSAAYDLDGNKVTKDFTPYSERVKGEYDYYLNEAGFWKVPEAVDLADTSWEATDYCLDGTEKIYYIDIIGNTLNIVWNDGIDEENHSYSATWSLKEVDGVTLMEIDLGNLDGIRSFPVLITTEHNLILFAQDFVNDDIRDYDKLIRVLERTFG